jgi:hypothetical protein
MNPSILPLVEGHSEVEAVPVLLRRLLASLDAFHIEVARPFRVKRTRILREGEIERALIQGLRSRSNVQGVLVILDQDDDEAELLEQALEKRGRQKTSLPLRVVAAERELEAWFLGSKEALRGVRGIRSDARAPTEPESIRGAKERLSRNMQDRRYVEVDDQPAFAERMDFDLATERCRSFRRLTQAVEQLVRRIPTPS